MEERKECCIISDFDGVIVNSLPLIDEYVQELDYKASDKYRKELVDRSNACHLEKQRLEEEQKFDGYEMDIIVQEIAELQRKRKDHYDRKNIVLEEVYPEFRNKIDYQKIYQIENAYEDAIETLIRIWERKIYERMIICTNINSGVEILAKRGFIKEYLPMAQLIPLRFFLDPYYDPLSGLKNLNRVPCDKLKTLTDRDKSINIPSSVAIDDTKGVIDSGNLIGFKCFHKKLEDNSADIFIQAANYTIDTVHGGKIKKLSR